MQKTWVHMLIGALMMGAWAGFANRAHPMPVPLIAGLVQGLLSAALTAYLKSAVEYLGRRIVGFARFILPPLIAVTGSGMLLYIVHSLAGTPEIWATLSVPLIVSGSYVFIWNLLQQRRQERA